MPAAERKMTRRQAAGEAHRRWGTDGHLPGTRWGWACRRRTAPRFEVGYHVRLEGGKVDRIVAGTSDESWEAALASARVS